MRIVLIKIKGVRHINSEYYIKNINFTHFQELFKLSSLNNIISYITFI